MTLNRRPSLLFATLVLVVATATPAFGAGAPTTPTTMPAQLENGSSDGGAAALAAASCLGCNAGWGLWENGNTIRALRASYTNEVLTFIHVHWALIKPNPDSCADMYDGPYANNGFLERSNTSADQIKDSNYAQGGQHTWTNAGATSGKTMGSHGRPAQAEQPISARTSVFSSFKFSFASAFVLLASLIGACSSGGGSTTSTQLAIPGVSNLVGIEADAQLLSPPGEMSVLEVTVTTHVRDLQRTCQGSQDCPEEHVFQVRSSALVDYRFGAVAEADVLVVENEVDATSSLAQVLTIEQVESGDHCVAVFSQVLEVVDGKVVGGEALIGTYEHLPSNASEASSNRNCSTRGLTGADGTFAQSDGSGCGGLPNGITTDPFTGSDLGVEELMVLVPTCQQDLVAVIISNGEILPNDTRLVAGHDEAGFMSYVMPKTGGYWRVATLPDEQFRGTVPDASPYWDVVVSPPREF